MFHYVLKGFGIFIGCQRVHQWSQDLFVVEALDFAKIVIVRLESSGGGRQLLSYLADRGDRPRVRHVCLKQLVDVLLFVGSIFVFEGPPKVFFILKLKLGLIGAAALIQGCVVGKDAVTCLQPIHDRHIYVHNNDVEVVNCVGYHYLEGVVSVFCLFNVEVFLELMCVAHQQEGVIVHKEHAGLIMRVH